MPELHGVRDLDLYTCDHGTGVSSGDAHLQNTEIQTTPMTERSEAQRMTDLGVVLPAYRWLASLFAVLVVVQAFLGTRGVFAAEEGLITGHGHLANGMFALIVIQMVLSWLLSSKRAVSMKEVGLNAFLVLLTVSQIGLGYSTRNGENYTNTVSLHIPNGVLLMGIAAIVAAMAWRVGSHKTSPTSFS